MKKSRQFRILSLAERGEILGLGRRIEEKYPVAVLKKPQKMLVMLKVRESARGSLFYAGEALACECTVSLREARGFGACLGDDAERARAMAAIDAALGAGIPERGEILEKLAGWEERIAEKQALEAELTMSTKVNFTVMEE
jgi:alpha-D-ribose 1-methylphosphonate 5-triphosphate synthase subunit PhnG